MKKRYRVSNELKPYVRRVLMTSFYSCRMVIDKNKQCWCETNASSNTFHRIVQRAKCEKRSREDGTFYVTSREAESPTILRTLLQQRGLTSYEVIDDRDGTRSLDLH